MYKRFTHSIMVTALVLVVPMGLLVVGASSPGHAAPPAKKDCNVGDVFDRLKCRHDAVADQLEYTSDTVFAPGTKLHERIESTRLGHIHDARDKGQRAKVKTTKERFKKQAKDEAQANRKGGHLVPLTAADDFDGDGICDYEQGDHSAKCAAVEVDEFGDLQECNPEKKNRGKGKNGLECDRSYDSEEAATVDEELDMEATATQMETTYDAVEEDFIKMNEHLDTVNANLPDGAGPALAAANGCVFPTLTPGLSEAVAVLRGLTAAAQGASNIMNSASGQTVVVFGSGGNGRAAAVILNSAALTVELAYITLDEILSSETSALQAATMDCVIQVAGDIAAMQTLMVQQHNAIMANDDANTDTIMNRIAEVRAELVQILNTPLGQRDQFPVK